MSSGLVNIGLTGLNAAQMGIRIAQQNISNASTAGYRRQTVGFVTAQPLFSGAGYLGNGVAVGSITHQYNQFLDTEVAYDQTQLARYQTTSDRAAQIDKLLGDSTTSLAPTLDQFFAAVQEVANDPSSPLPRQNLLAAGNTLTGRFNMLADKLEPYRSSSNAELQAVVQQINTLTSQIAQANANIADSTQTNGQLPNDMIDNRDKLIGDLNKLVNVTRQDVGGGITNVYMGNGQSLVNGNSAYTMGTQPSGSDPSLLSPTLNVGGSSIVLGSNLVTGGQLGGLLDYQQNVLIPATATLNLIAMQVASKFNQQHRQGVDFNLAAGGDFFVNPVVPQGSTTSQLILDANNATSVDPTGYQLSYDGTQYTLKALSTGVTQTFDVLNSPTPPQTAVDAGGLTFTLAPGSSAPAAGDTWQIDTQYARVMALAITTTNQIAAAGAGAGGPGDNTNALALAGLQTQALLNGSSSSFDQAYNQLVSNTATKASQSDLNRAAFQTLTDNSVAALNSQVGVNLDEEAANLIQFQQAYQASARAIQVANSLFDDILTALK